MNLPLLQHLPPIPLLLLSLLTHLHSTTATPPSALRATSSASHSPDPLHFIPTPNNQPTNRPILSTPLRSVPSAESTSLHPPSPTSSPPSFPPAVRRPRSKGLTRPGGAWARLAGSSVPARRAPSHSPDAVLGFPIFPKNLKKGRSDPVGGSADGASGSRDAPAHRSALETPPRRAAVAVTDPASKGKRALTNNFAFTPQDVAARLGTSPLPPRFQAPAKQGAKATIPPTLRNSFPWPPGVPRSAPPDPPGPLPNTRTHARSSAEPMPAGTGGTIAPQQPGADSRRSRAAGVRANSGNVEMGKVKTGGGARPGAEGIDVQAMRESMRTRYRATAAGRIGPTGDVPAKMGKRSEQDRQ